MCKVHLCGLALIVDLFFQTFHFIPMISTKYYLTNCKIIPSVKGMLEFYYKYGIDFNLHWNILLTNRDNFFFAELSPICDNKNYN